MRCSFFEARLDEFALNALPPRDRARVAAHLAHCAGCSALLAELRVVDALLIAPRRMEPAPNFTFAVMAEIRSLPQPHARRIPAAGVLAAYLGFAWSLIFAVIAFGGAGAREIASLAAGSLNRYAEALGALAGATSHLTGGDPLRVGAAMGAILLLDGAVALAFAITYGVLRPRLAAAGRPGDRS